MRPVELMVESSSHGNATYNQCKEIRIILQQKHGPDSHKHNGNVNNEEKYAHQSY
jgi:hypothetical protein